MHWMKELKQIPVWLKSDHQVVKRRAREVVTIAREEGWARQLALVEKFDPRIDVLIGASVRALTEILRQDSVFSCF